ncbi:chloride channel protein [Piscinibacter koreensis]|uniref:Chloride channel protein n=1 Tax=Piscinibacter koreensis TaxID=2742824 RepID=A0A7Y6TYC4_9BURK|nr:chloride channel protein [Schlegelella koreensis]NUZ08103.1 chloride channel protein [Schlegelella koreensis]
MFDAASSLALARRRLARAIRALRNRVRGTSRQTRADVAPDFWSNLRDELAAGGRWLDRVVVLVYASLTGLSVVGFTLLTERANAAFEAMRQAGAWGAWLPVLWTPGLTVLLLWWTRRFAPGAHGSGIPQVMRALDEAIEPAQRSWLVSTRLSLQKIALVTGGMLAGLSIGREGPTVQVGAGIMAGARRWLSRRSTIDVNDLMVAGAAAGIAAAFNTPLGGIVFAFEQLSRRHHLSNSSLVISSIVLAGLVSVAVFGNVTYFGQLRVQTLSWDLLGPGLVVALVAGLAGGLFSRLVVASARGLPDRVSRWRAAHPLRFAAACAAGVAMIGVVTDGATAGAGYAPTRAMLEGTQELPGVFTVLKFCATWLSAWTGVPAGLFAPSLTIGAGIGHDVALFTGVAPEAAIPLIALGMVGFLAATTQGPVTAFIIVMEMVSGHSMVLSLMACALLASAVSRLLTAPMYLELGALISLPAPSGAPSPAPR